MELIVLKAMLQFILPLILGRFNNTQHVKVLLFNEGQNKLLSDGKGKRLLVNGLKPLILMEYNT